MIYFHSTIKSFIIYYSHSKYISIQLEILNTIALHIHAQYGKNFNPVLAPFTVCLQIITCAANAKIMEKMFSVFFKISLDKFNKSVLGWATNTHVFAENKFYFMKTINKILFQDIL